MITVDTPCVGNRDEDRRLKAREELELGVPKSRGEDGEPKVVPGRNTGGLSRSLSWGDLAWIREAWGGPIALKGIQSEEDARVAMEAGVEAIYLSNHGGRQLHSAPPCLATLLRIRRCYPEVLERCEVFVDGAATRGGDILKAICLGARAVGIGRSFLYAMGAYGPQGVHKAIDSEFHHHPSLTYAHTGHTHGYLRSFTSLHADDRQS
jgi:L-lactate dehydrogenase (cytochrome)